MSADDLGVRTDAGIVLRSLIDIARSVSEVDGTFIEGAQDTASVWVRDSATAKYFRIHVEELDADSVEAQGLDSTLRT